MKLKEKMVFRFKDKGAGDFKGLLIFVSKILKTSKDKKSPCYHKGKLYSIVTQDGYMDFLDEREMKDIDPKSVRPHNSDIDPDFYGMAG